MNDSKTCACAAEIERLSRELEELKEELELFQRYMFEVTDALAETGDKFLGIEPNDYY